MTDDRWSAYLTYVVPTPPCTKGDLDNDGDWDIFDILRLVEIVLENPPPPSQYELCAADMDEDGDQDIFDIMMCVDKVLE